MKSLLLGFLMVWGCGAADQAPPPAHHSEAERSDTERSDTEQPAHSTSCSLLADEVSAPELPQDLLAVAPQYAHPGHRTGFDAYRGQGSTFPWYDRYDLQSPAVPPHRARVSASTPTRLFVSSQTGELGILPRGGSSVSWTGTQLYAVEAVDARDGESWVLGRDAAGYRIARVDAASAVFVDSLTLPNPFHDRRIALTADGQLAVAWLERDVGTLRVKVRFGTDAAITADQVTLPEPVAALSERSHVALSITAHSTRGVGVAWRPLADPNYTDVGSRQEPPTTPSTAEVRWLIIEPGVTPSSPFAHATTAHPLGFVTGIGPWPLGGNGMTANTIDGHAVFVWLDGGRIAGAVAGVDSVVELASTTRAPLLFFRSNAGSEELLAFDSSPAVRAFTVSCR